MITVTIYKDSGQYAGFTARGHAGYAEEGFDIVCAAASALTINCLNSLEAFTEDSFRGEEKDGFLIPGGRIAFPPEASTTAADSSPEWDPRVQPLEKS